MSYLYNIITAFSFFFQLCRGCRLNDSNRMSCSTPVRGYVPSDKFRIFEEMVLNLFQYVNMKFSRRRARYGAYS